MQNKQNQVIKVSTQFKQSSQNSFLKSQSYTKLQNLKSSNFQPQNSSSFKFPQTSNVSEYQTLLYENKIQILNDRLQCYIQETQNLKRTNSILINKLSTIQEIDEELEQQKMKNFQLREQLQNYRDKIEEEKLQNQSKIKDMEVQLQEKQKFVSLMRIQHQKIVSKKEQQINFLRDALKQKINKLQKYEKKLHSLQISRLKSQEDSDNFNFERDSLSTRKSNISKYNSHSSENINSMNTSNSISVQQKAKQFMKKDKNELKIYMKSINHAQKCLQIGGHQLSMIGLEKQQQKSILGGSRLAKSKINKTYCK